MISYFKEGKDKLSICEDSLTASVFDVLKYFPTHYFWTILKDSLLLDTLPKFSGEIQEIVFWPKWSAENTYNSKFVEPDVFIRFSEFDLIVEAKRYDANQQYNGQLENEVIGYFNEYEEDAKDLYLLQVGGLQENCTKDSIYMQSKKIAQSKTNWSRLLLVITNLHNKIINQQLPDQSPLIFLFNDLINAFAMHGFHQKKWLIDCDTYKINSNAIQQFNF
ncbi:hypothetical protein [Tenacibaculum singaporense]|uniref:Uncharacterized protein n=1 Tax=Tenacibaculum singaporense TaxID=2358479 RepID=A0A3Q8RQ55_9FLAO|nr:hypothetical protein [Tenacibaculum singaporense]AZJ36618.1 hypothetical protein D6T69_14190 [Tenacibaculum singaporense]